MCLEKIINECSVASCVSSQQVRKLLSRRRSSTKVSPDIVETVENPTVSSRENESTKHTTLQKEGSRKHLLLFGGIHTPIKKLELKETSEGFISVNQLYNSMNNGPMNVIRDFLLIIDTRAEEDYKLNHIANSKHYLSLASGWRYLKKYTLIVLYDHKGLSYTIRESTMSHLLAGAQSVNIDIFLLEGGFDAFQTKYPFLCEHQQSETRLFYPSVIIDNQLYLGRGDQATNAFIISNLGITHIVNISTEHSSSLTNIKYMNVPISDEASADILSLIPSVILFLIEAFSHDGKALVHCNLGISRSSTLVLAYLMYTRHWTLEVAYKYVRERRPIVHPNNGFISQLILLEEMLFGSKLTAQDDLHIINNK